MNVDLATFNSPGHWYTSYPSLNHWGDFGHKEYCESLRSFALGGKPLHLYLHIPFCEKLCYYCLCNIIISNDRQKIQFFLDHLLKEIDLLRKFFLENGVLPNIVSIHFGGGTPSHLDQDQFTQLCEKLNTLIPLRSLDEVSMEIDPRTVVPEDLKHYASLGVTRISFGIQDFDPEVQKVINREQPPEMIEALLTPEVRKLFTGVNFDLLYGLPKQTHQTLEKTLEQVRHLDPSRITLLKYCHAPEVRRHMKLIKESDLPPEKDFGVMFVNTVEKLLDFGYRWVGLDHFAKPEDSLALGMVNGNLYRNFTGYLTTAQDMIGLGPTTTGGFGSTYVQSFYNLTQYYDSINNGEFPILRGYKMTYDDTLRREVIFSLLCHLKVDFRQFGNYFNRELTILESMPELCHLKNGILYITEAGRVLLRNVCKVFDNKDVLPEHNKISQFTIKRVA